MLFNFIILIYGGGLGAFAGCGIPICVEGGNEYLNSNPNREQVWV
jgi:hypothetical protein